MKQKEMIKSNSCEGNDFIEARYANYFEIGHNSVEFILNFGQSYESGVGGNVHTRIITSPVYAKDLLDTLQKSVSEFKKKNAVQGAVANEQSERDSTDSIETQKDTSKAAFQG